MKTHLTAYYCYWQGQLGDNVNSHQAALVAQLAVTEEGLTAVDERVSLLVVQVL